MAEAARNEMARRAWTEFRYSIVWRSAMLSRLLSGLVLLGSVCILTAGTGHAGTLVYDNPVITVAQGTTSIGIGATLTLGVNDPVINTDAQGSLTFQYLNETLSGAGSLFFVGSLQGVRVITLPETPQESFLANAEFLPGDAGQFDNLSLGVGSSQHFDLGQLVIPSSVAPGVYTTDLGILRMDVPFLPIPDPYDYGTYIVDISPDVTPTYGATLTVDVTPDVAAIVEPSSGAILALSLAPIALLARRARGKRKATLSA